MNLAPALLNAVRSREDNPKSKPVDNTVRREWNKYLSWLDTHKLKGSAELDKGTNADQALMMYKKENPSTPITKELIPIIQKDFQGYRQSVLDRTKLPKGTSGRAELAPGTTEENFLPNLSVVDGIAGSRTTSFAYPDEYLQTLEKDGKGNILKKSIENKGFVATN